MGPGSAYYVMNCLPFAGWKFLRSGTISPSFGGFRAQIFQFHTGRTVIFGSTIRQTLRPHLRLIK